MSSSTGSELHTVGPFVLGRTLGEGATGRVKLAFHKESGFKVALKIIKKSFLVQKKSLYKKVGREIAVLKTLQHQNLLALYEVYETSRYLFLVLEYAENGELFDHLLQRGPLSIPTARVFFQQLVYAIDYIHSNHVCHRDVKLENLLLGTENMLKLGDFGMAAILRKDHLLSTSCGSPHYASPEVVEGVKYDGRCADVWSCGVVLYALLTGCLPFDDDSIVHLLRKVKKGVFNMPGYLPVEVRGLVSGMLTVDPKERLTIRDVCKHPWLHDYPFPLCPFLRDDCAAISNSDLDPELVATSEVMLALPKAEIIQALTSSKFNDIRALYCKLVEFKAVSPEKIYLGSIDVRSARDRSSTFGPSSITHSLSAVHTPPQREIQSDARLANGRSSTEKDHMDDGSVTLPALTSMPRMIKSEGGRARDILSTTLPNTQAAPLALEVGGSGRRRMTAALQVPGSAARRMQLAHSPVVGSPIVGSPARPTYYPGMLKPPTPGMSGQGRSRPPTANSPSGTNNTSSPEAPLDFLRAPILRAPTPARLSPLSNTKKV